MIFYERETLLGLVIASLPALLSLYFFYQKGNIKTAVALLMVSAFLLRMLMISLDPFVHEWDERYHALVARNMMDYPFRPMLFTKHIMEYNPLDWAYLHIWVHKQPVFLWQMALSMKVFGVSAFALRLPSAIMGCIMVWMTYDISRKWIQDHSVAFISAFLSAFSYYALELISGWMSLEHNDLAFTFYMTCCFWAFTRYVYSGYQVKWAVWIGIFSGLAILNKWLTGFLIFGGWGLYLILNWHQLSKRKILHIGMAFFITCIIFIPWQIYIMKAFPAESAIMYEYNRRHMVEDLSHPGNAFYHINFLPTAYHIALLPFLLIGLVSIFFSRIIDKKLSISFAAMILVLFTFFSFFVATKMPAFVYPVSALMLILIAYGIQTTFEWMMKKEKIDLHIKKLILATTVLIAGLLSFKPWLITKNRASDDQFRNNKIHNSSAFKNMDEDVIQEYVILNTRAYENIELMFYRGGLAYHWYPQERTLDSLQNSGYKFAAFDYPGDQQQLPSYIVEDKEILILEEKLK